MLNRGRSSRSRVLDITPATDMVMATARGRSRYDIHNDMQHSDRMIRRMHYITTGLTFRTMRDWWRYHVIHACNDTQRNERMIDVLHNDWNDHMHGNDERPVVVLHYAWYNDMQHSHGNDERLVEAPRLQQRHVTMAMAVTSPPMK